MHFLSAVGFVQVEKTARRSSGRDRRELSDVVVGVAAAAAIVAVIVVIC